MRRLFVLLLLACPLQAETVVTLLHFSDYHSHAVPFYTEAGERGGIARAIGYLAREKRRGALVFNGGDTINKGAPAWSDKYGCAEWPWLNGIVDAMAFGNHEPDYGRAAFDRCRASVSYPILSANTPGFRPYVVLRRSGVRIGVFAVAGSDFQRLKVGEALAKPGEPPVQFGAVVDAARAAVRALREQERVDAVVMIGHEYTEDDYALARAVPGIDLIFGSHSHLERPLTQIEGTQTAFISPGQYLELISRVEMTIGEGRVKSVRGALIPVDANLPEDRRTARRVARMQRDLEKDPRFSALFTPIGQLSAPVSVDALAARTLEVMRKVSGAELAISTTSSFRAALPAGTLTPERLRRALPYDNEIVVCAMQGTLLERLRAESYVSGAIDPAKTYRTATTDYLAGREKLQCEKTGVKVRSELQKTFQ